MTNTLLDASLTSGALPITVGILCAAVLAAVVTRRPHGRWWWRFAIAAAAGVAIGFCIAWYVGDVENAFDVSLTFATRAWFAGGVAGITVGAVSLWRARRWRVAAGIATIALFALAGGLGVNATVGEFPTVADALGLDSIHSLHISPHASSPTHASPPSPLWKTWTPPPDLPKAGSVGTQVIPATASHFVARAALVYLPPAALVKHPPALPVMVFLGGQPGSPQTVVEAGQMPEIMNAFAAAHQGLAPIVVIPDQLGAPEDNPMCLNSSLGQVETYLTVDVPNWIRTHLDVLRGRDDWTIAGFSEGGTCSIGLGTKFRSLFGSIVDISGQSAPLNGSIAHTVAVGFGGSVAAYHAGSAPGLLAAGAPFSTTLGIFVVGAGDTRYGPQTAIVERDARAAGMQVHAFISPGTAHDWFTEQYGVRVALPLLASAEGLVS